MLGYEFEGFSPDNDILLNINGRSCKLKLLYNFEFTSDR